MRVRVIVGVRVRVRVIVGLTVGVRVTVTVGVRVGVRVRGRPPQGSRRGCVHRLCATTDYSANP